MNAYRTLGEQAGTPEARDLAADLQSWHDEMVMHLRALRLRGGGCPEECPHSQARVLWPMALAAFGDGAAELVLLRTHGAPAGGRTMPDGAARFGS